MTSVLVYVSVPEPGLLLPDLQAAGLTVQHVVLECNKLVQQVASHAPDMVICALDHPGAAFFTVTQAIAETRPCPVMVFTQDTDAAHIGQAMASGVHAYVMDGYAGHRLPSSVLLAQARFRDEQAAHAALLDISSRLEERKVVDRAKTILMRARELSDDDAFRVLRTASMHSNQRLDQVSQYVIHSAHFAEGVNRAGQLRMLSQRLVKLYLLQLLRLPGARCTCTASLGHLYSALTQTLPCWIKTFQNTRLAIYWA